jgi:hypothetical protein
MAIYGFCHYSDGAPVIGWEAIGRPHIKQMTNEQAYRKKLRDDAVILWRESNELADMVGIGGVTWDDVRVIQDQAKTLENKAFGR